MAEEEVNVATKDDISASELVVYVDGRDDGRQAPSNDDDESSRELKSNPSSEIDHAESGNTGNDGTITQQSTAGDNGSASSVFQNSSSLDESITNQCESGSNDVIGEITSCGSKNDTFNTSNAGTRDEQPHSVGGVVANELHDQDQDRLLTAKLDDDFETIAEDVVQSSSWGEKRVNDNEEVYDNNDDVVMLADINSNESGDNDYNDDDDDEFIWSTAISNIDVDEIDSNNFNATKEDFEDEGHNHSIAKNSKDATTTSTNTYTTIEPTPLTPEQNNIRRSRIRARDIVKTLQMPTTRVQKQQKEPTPPPLSQDSSISSWQPTWDVSPSGHSESRQSIGESSATMTSPFNRSRSLQYAELELYRRLDAEYEQALEDREVSWKARYTSVRHSALFSSILMILYLVLGCWFYTNHTTWDITDSLLFTVYSVTTVGYGNHMIPKTASFQVFTIWYILVGIALITVLAAHMYQLIVLEATKVHFERDTAELARRSAAVTAALEAEDTNVNSTGIDQTDIPDDSQHSSELGGGRQMISSSSKARFMAQLHAQIIHEHPRAERIIDILFVAFEKTKKFLKETHTGQVLSVFLPFCGLILFGAIVVGSLEGWTIIESLYWAVVTLTTVGFGDYHPTQKASTWFCIFYLPCSLFFMSFFLAKVAQSYIKLHAVHVQRLEHRMRTQLQRSRDEMMIQQSISSSAQSTSEMEGIQIGMNPPTPPLHSSSDVVEESANAQTNTNSDDDGADNGVDNDILKPSTQRSNSPIRGFLGNRRFRDVSPTKRNARQTVALGFEFLPPSESDGSIDDNNHQWNYEGRVKKDSDIALSFQTNLDLSQQRITNRRRLRFGGNFISTPLDSSSAGKRHREKVWNNSMSHSTTTGSGGSRSDNKRNSPHRIKCSSGNHSSNVYAFKTTKAVLDSMSLSTTSNNSSTKSQEQQQQQHQQQRRSSNSRNANDVASSEAGTNTNSEGGGGATGVDKQSSSTSYSNRNTKKGGVSTATNTTTRPSFALRMLVQQRLAQIIAIEVAGFQSEVTIEENTLKVTIPSLKDTAEKWMLPRRARKAFRTVAFQSLFYVGERDLIIKGADTLLNLSPFEFHGLLSPVLAAMGDGETMEDWLASTNVMADVELTNLGISAQTDRLFKEDEHEII